MELLPKAPRLRVGDIADFQQQPVSRALVPLSHGLISSGFRQDGGGGTGAYGSGRPISDVPQPGKVVLMHPSLALFTKCVTDTAAAFESTERPPDRFGFITTVSRGEDNCELHMLSKEYVNSS